MLNEYEGKGPWANRRLEAVILCGLKEVEGIQQLIR